MKTSNLSVTIRPGILHIHNDDLCPHFVCIEEMALLKHVNSVHNCGPVNVYCLIQ